MHKSEINKFQEVLWQHFAKSGRHDLPWRLPEPDGSFNAYKILVSELMLQQTQVSRVIPKFHEFLMKFPTARGLAQAPLADVLLVWSGLGYNRRAKFLWQAAQKLQADFNGVFPATITELTQLPGVGVNTAGAIAAYAFNEPVVFIETNIRTVYIHHFFNDQLDVSDAAIRDVLEQTLDRENPREFYWALMDYGSHLKQTVGNASRLSKHYAKQSKFEGSRRQVRGRVLKALGGGGMSDKALVQAIPDERLAGVLQDLLNENMIRFSGNKWLL